ncbi:unnamed protein product [Timema podura]|uniref:Uncharacterized protein n=1 Tax=Timema podura TaxID=61482 RepID=A0ABN7P365_TIMPD|nr:unnamed protein product [Timema podura]
MFTDRASNLQPIEPRYTRTKLSSTDVTTTKIYWLNPARGLNHFEKEIVYRRMRCSLALI